MIWVFSISAILITLFLGLEFQGERSGKKNRFFSFLAGQDWRIEEAVAKLNGLWKNFRRFLKFIFFVRLPFFLHIAFKKISYKVIDRYKKLKDYFRGKYIAHQKNKNSSSYLKKISKTKEETKDDNNDYRNS